MNKIDPIILVVEDEEYMTMLIEEVLSRRGYTCIAVNNGNDALKAYNDNPIAITLMDIKIPGPNGLEVLEKVLSIDSRAVVIMITAYGTIEVAVDAMRKGAFDFITKPFEIDELEQVVDKGLSTWELVSENRCLREQLEALTGPTRVVGNSVSMERIKELVSKVAKTDYSILITGESGTGKSLLAKSIHEQSRRRSRQFIKINCAAIPTNLIESELFGHEKGAFTGAYQRKHGKFERANQGTIFLDEISTLDLTAQAKLLQILQEQQFERVGGSETLDIDVRVIAASNQNLKHLVEQGKFREDLFFRLNVIPIEMPSLRERKEDIIPIAHFLLQRLQPDKELLIAPQTAALLKNHLWPGNVREMENVLKQAIVLLGNNEVILPDYLPQEIHNKQSMTNNEEPRIKGENLKEIMKNFERDLITKTIKDCDSNVHQAAERLGLPIRTLYFRLNKLKIGSIDNK